MRKLFVSTCFLVFLLLLFSGCARHVTPTVDDRGSAQSQGAEDVGDRQSAQIDIASSVLPDSKDKSEEMGDRQSGQIDIAAAVLTDSKDKSAVTETCSEEPVMNEGKGSRECYTLQPGKVTKNRQGKLVTGRCQPQSLIYARCRTGIRTCRLGDTGPVQWYNCAQKRQATSAFPSPGSVMVLSVNKKRGMPTGHPAYVEDVAKNSDGTWTLRISHTNYDRKCHLDENATVIFYPATMEASFMSGAWVAWAKKLKVSGFILR